MSEGAEDTSFSREAFREVLESPRLGRIVYPLATVSSTQDVAKSLVRDAQGLSCDGLVVCARAQTAGRGRQGRTFVSPSDVGLYMTLVLDEPLSTRVLGFLSLVAGAATVNAIRQLSPELGERLAIKWPNDVLIDGKKCAGILCEAQPDAVYVGIGINLRERSWPEELRGRATSLEGSLGGLHNFPTQLREHLLAHVLNAFDVLLAELCSDLRLTGGGTAPAQSRAHSECAERSRPALVNIVERDLAFMQQSVSVSGVTGTVLGLANDGSLVVDTGQGEPEHLRTGEVERHGSL